MERKKELIVVAVAEGDTGYELVVAARLSPPEATKKEFYS
jgi:hypothetical protein